MIIMSQPQFDHNMANGSAALNNDLLLVDAALNLANGHSHHNNHHLSCDSRVGQSLVAAAAAATLMGTSPPTSAHSDQHPGFPSDNNKLSLMSNDSNNNSLGSNGSLNGSSIGSNKGMYGHHMMNGGGGSLNMAIGGNGGDAITGSSSGSPSPSSLMMKPPMNNMQFYQQQWQQKQHQFLQNRQQQQMQFLQGLQEHQQQQHRLHQNVSKGAISPNAALTGECPVNDKLCTQHTHISTLLCIASHHDPMIIIIRSSGIISVISLS